MAWPFSNVAAPNFDTGPGSAVPTSAGVLTVDPVWLLCATFTNTNAAERVVTIADGSGAIVEEIIVPGGGSPEPKEFPFRPVTGVQWIASGAGVVGHLWGYK
jgi:hypothetical protein